MAASGLQFVGWRLAREGGSPWRRIVDVERDGQHVGEAEACLTSATAAALAADVGRELADEEIAQALMRYAEDQLRELVDQGQNLGDHSLIIEVDSEDRKVLLGYLQD
jgi:hypothetical protein